MRRYRGQDRRRSIGGESGAAPGSALRIGSRGTAGRRDGARSAVSSNASDRRLHALGSLLIVRDPGFVSHKRVTVPRPDSAEHLKETTLRWMAGVVGIDQGLANYMPGSDEAEADSPTARGASAAQAQEEVKMCFGRVVYRRTNSGRV